VINTSFTRRSWLVEPVLVEPALLCKWGISHVMLFNIYRSDEQLTTVN